MDYRGQKIEEENNQKGTLLSLVLHLALLGAMIFMPTCQVVKYVQKESTIQVELPQDLLGGGPALGLPDQGKGDNPAPGKPDPNAGQSTPTPSKPQPEPDPEPIKPVKPVISKPVPAPTPIPPTKTQTTEDPAAVALRRQQEDARKRVEEEKYRQAQVEKDKRRADDAVKAEAQRQKDEADAKARAEQAAKDKFKNRFPGTGTQSGSNGGGGTGTGQGNTGKPGNQGRPDGDPDSKVLDGFGKGPGTVNGFNGRGVRSAPKLQENSQKAGRVVLDVCVDADGSVTSAKFKAVGSSTTEDDLIDAAVRNARQYKFAAGGADKQCGTITYNFIVR
jgi:outer membrane biosynthesis protein TonB